MENFDYMILRQSLHRLYLRMMEPVLERFGLTQMEEDILLFLANNPGHDTAAELVNLRCLAKSQVSTSVERLVQRGYILRRPEGRKIHLRLLPAAEEAVRQGQESQKRFGEAIARGFSPEEQAMLYGTLTRMTENALRTYRELTEEQKT
ncbi:MAG: MarR family transcriptional regulator [Oscillospiraceae bacterium]|nr:MarR family transcriptional regulator [Oscillospiraceae bacterium]